MSDDKRSGGDGRKPPRGPRKPFSEKGAGGKSFGGDRASSFRGGDSKPRSRGADGDAPPRRSFADRSEGRDAERPARARPDGDRPRTPYGDKPRSSFGGDRPRSEGDRPRAPYGDRPRPSFGGDRPRSEGDRPRTPYGDRPRPSFGGDRPRSEGDRPRAPYGDRPRPSFGGDRPRSEGDRPRTPYGDKPRSSFGGDRPRSESDRPRAPYGDRPRPAYSDRPARSFDDNRPPRSFDDAEAGRQTFEPRFEERRERRPDRPAPRREVKPERREPRPSEAGSTFEGDRVAKVIARSGLGSRRDAEDWINAGRVAVNGEVLVTAARNVTRNDRITVDGVILPHRERTRLWLYHKPRGLVTTEKDPEGRPTVFENLPEGLPRVMSIGRLDINTEGLLLLTNDGGLARLLELPKTGWLRRYRARAHGTTDPLVLERLAEGVTVEGVDYGPIEARIDREQGDNVWLTIGLREGKNREVKNVLGSIDLEVNRLIRVSYGPFQLGDIAEGAVEEVKTRIIADQLGPELAAEAECDFDSPAFERPVDAPRPGPAAPAAKGSAARDDKRRGLKFKPDESEGERVMRGGLIEDRRGRRVLVQRVTDVKEERSEERRPARRFDGDRPRPRPLREDRPDRDSSPARPFHPANDHSEEGAVERPFKPRRFEDRNAGGDRPFRARPSGGDRPERSDRPFTPRGDRPFTPRGDRPERSDRPFTPRGDRPFTPRGDRPERSDRPFTQRGDRPFTPRGDRPERSDRPFTPRGDRPERSDRPFTPRGDRPERSDRPFTPCGDRSFTPRGDRPERSDRPFTPRGDRPFTPRGDRPERSDRPFTPRGDRPERSDRPFTPRGDRPERSEGGGDRPFKPRFGGGGKPGGFGGGGRPGGFGGKPGGFKGRPGGGGGDRGGSGGGPSSGGGQRRGR